MMLEACFGPALQVEPLLEVTHALIPVVKGHEEFHAMASSNRRRVVNQT